ncbi:hypothetical protein TNCV_4942981 [Trichonephila clavipes]|nr:hypothetical protein TNCV_4942981 [Trichonephila clavipes]
MPKMASSGKLSDVSDKVLRSIIRTNPPLSSTEVGFKVEFLRLLLWVALKDFVSCPNSLFGCYKNYAKKLKDRILISTSNFAHHKREPFSDHMETGYKK